MTNYEYQKMEILKFFKNEPRSLYSFKQHISDDYIDVGLNLGMKPDYFIKMLINDGDLIPIPEENYNYKLSKDALKELENLEKMYKEEYCN